MNAPRATTRHRTLRRLLAAPLLLAILALATGCPDTDDDDDSGSSDGSTPRFEPDTFAMSANPPTVTIAEGETGSVEFDTRTQASWSSSNQYEAIEPPASLRFVPGLRREWRQRHDIETRGLAPGIYDVLVQLKRGSRVEDELTLTVVVTPATGPGTPSVRDIDAGDFHSVALLEDGTVWCWGRNDRGQLGDGTQYDRPVPVQVQGLPRAAIAIAAGGRHTMALLDDNTVWCWGDNRELQAGTIDTGPPPELLTTPVQAICYADRCRVDSGGTLDVGPVPNVVAIAAGQAHSMALTGDGVVVTWGDADEGQLGHAVDRSRRVAFEAPVPARITAIAAGRNFSLALDDTGQVWGWGDNGANQLGDDLQPQYDSPIDLLGFVDVVAIAGGSSHTMALLSNGRVRVAGSNTFSQLGVPNYEGAIAVDVPNLFDVVAVDAGFVHSLALRSDGTVWAWGNNSFNQLGFPEVGGPSEQATPVLVQGPANVVAIAAGGRHALSRVSGCPGAWSWGDNIAGQLGDGTNLAHGFPVQVDGLGEQVAAAACEASLTVAVQGDGRVTSNPRGLDGIDCGGSCSESFEEGTLVTLTAEAAEGWVFEGWSGAVESFASSVDVLLDVSRNCIAVFSRIPVPPVAEFTFSPENPIEGEIIRLDASASSAPDGRVVLYEWDEEDDGTFDQDDDSPVTFVRYRDPGTYTVRLRVTDDIGLTDETTRLIVVEREPEPEPPPEPGTLVTLTIDFRGGGFGTVNFEPAAEPCQNDCTRQFPAGTVITLDGVAAEDGFFFSHWQGCADGPSVDCSFTLDADRTVEAHFE